MMRKVYVCAPLGGDVESNLKKVRAYTEYALRCGTAPVVPHFYAECLDDNDPKDREIGLAAGLSLLWFCDELWLFGDTVTDGMKNELQFCKNLNIRIRKITNMPNICSAKFCLKAMMWNGIPNEPRVCSAGPQSKATSMRRTPSVRHILTEMSLLKALTRPCAC